MASLNIIHLIGNLTRDVDLRATPRGTSVGQFGIAVNRQFKDESGASRDATTFIDIEAWGKQAETLAKYVGKGSPLYVQGRLKLEQWTDKESQQKRSKLKVVLEEFQFLGGSPRSANGAPAAAAANNGTPAAPPSAPAHAPRAQQGEFAAAGGGRAASMDTDDNVPF